jgi:hypothetical protein
MLHTVVADWRVLTYISVTDTTETCISLPQSVAALLWALWLA